MKHALPASLSFGGRACTLRLLRPDDGPRLIEFFESHTPETIHWRYGYHISQMTPQRAAQLVGVDPARDAALGIFEHAGPHLRLAAVGRYCLLDEAPAAEVAFVVREDCRRLGMARALLNALSELARHQGLRRFVAQVQPGNHAMLHLFRRRHAQITAMPGADAVEVTLDL